MANEEHLEVLRQGVGVWNKWRKDYPEVRPDLKEAGLSEATLSYATLSGAILSFANLSRADLTSAILSDADLTGTNLRRADLTGAIISYADLTGVDLTGANLTDASLFGANLFGASLFGANLIGANLSHADLSHANLSHANLSRADLFETSFGNTNLSRATGLDTCRHSGPSILDYRTLARSGDLPKTFLQGCGLPDWLIEAYKLTQKDLSTDQVTDIAYKIAELRSDPALQFYSCFISYATKDDPFATKLHGDLQEAGVRCWFSPEDIQSGRKLHRQITDAIRLHDKLLLILSEHSLASSWVETEIRRARRRELREGRQMLFPLRLMSFDALREWELFDADEGRDLAAEVREYFIPDFSNWEDKDAYAQAFDKLLQDLRAS